VWRGTIPHDVNVLQLRRLQRVSGITVHAKHARAKQRSPERGLISRGHTGSSLAGVQLEHYPSRTPSRDNWDNGDNSRILLSVILMPLKDSGTSAEVPAIRWPSVLERESIEFTNGKRPGVRCIGMLVLAMVVVKVVKLCVPIFQCRLF
jgi:hypothetical protein